MAIVLFSLRASAQQPSGSIRGVVHDSDFDVPLAAARVIAIETGQSVLTNDQGNYVFDRMAPGVYTLVFSKDGYVRQVRAEVLVNAGALTDVDVALAGEFTEMDEFLVPDVLQLGAGTEAALLRLRFESPALMDSIGSELMSRAGAGDAASALRLVAGASVQDGRFAVIRGLPDRYVNSQMNRVRLPTADEDKRAVELDQFPAAVIESIQVSKTFTPDQQGDASGGAVNLELKAIPDETILEFKSQVGANSQAAGRGDFLTYRGGGLNFWGRDYGDRDIQFQNLGGNWDGAAGVTEGEAPLDYKWSLTAGKRFQFDNGVKIGGSASVYYERDSSYSDNGTDDSYWVQTPGAGMTPQTNQGVPSQGDFKTALFDVRQGSQSVQWGSLATFGVETKNHLLTLTYLYTRSAEDVATLAEDTRGKEHFFPGYDPSDPNAAGNQPGNLKAAPYLRLETLEYTERSTDTLQLRGRHELGLEDFVIADAFKFHSPQLDWTASQSSASMYQPDKRLFGALFRPAHVDPGVPGSLPPFKVPATWFIYTPSANFNLGNFQRIWKSIDEESRQLSLNVNVPFEQWGGESGYLKAGLFEDHVERAFDQDTFSNFGDAGAFFLGNFDEFWSEVFPFENHPITESLFDVDYVGDQRISAGYMMVDLPLSGSLNVIGGARLERTKIGVVNTAESSATWFPPGATAPVSLGPGEADVDFESQDLLPSIGLVFEPLEPLTLRGSFSQTVARQTFKELTPVLQQEYAGGPVFIGDPELQMSAVQNYDLRADYVPYEGGLISVSWFRKEIEDPIEYVQRPTDFTFTTPVNYPDGELEGCELEVRQSLGRLWSPLEGVALGANATFIESEVELSASEAAGFNLPGIQAPMSSREMTHAPEHLYNFFLTWDLAATGTQFGLFYTVQGDTLVAGAGQSNGNFVPNVYARGYDTLNVGVTQKLGRYFKLQLQAKNLTNPEIQEVYRSEYIGDDVTKTSYTRGVEYSLSLGARVSF